jgi:Uncharacterized conserved protein
MLEGSCLCGKVRWRFRGEPGPATACNCTACRRYGALWIYGYEGQEIEVEGETTFYTRGPNSVLDFRFCRNCGAIAAWRATAVGEDGRRRMAVNVRLCEPDAVGHILIDHFDGLDTFEDLPRDGRTVADMWS